MSGEHSTSQEKEKVTNALNAGAGVPGVFNTDADISEDKMTEKEVEEFFENTKQYQVVTGTMPEFDGNRIVTSERSSQPGPLKIETGRICDLMQDVSGFCSDAYNWCEQTYDTEKICWIMMEDVKFLKKTSDISNYVDSIRN